MIHIFDGANVLLRDMTTKTMPGQNRLSLRQRYEQTAAAPAGSLFWCFDGRGHNERRKAIYPRYKINREPAAENHYAQINLWKEMLGHTNAIVIECEGWEADDVGATMARRLAAAGHPITCHSNDGDWHQLTLMPNVKINGIKNAPCAPRWIPLFKALVGDKSDDIDGVPAFGAKTWTDLENWWPELEHGIVMADPEAFLHIPIPKRCKSWFLSEGNLMLLQAMLTITHMINVPDDELAKGIKTGSLNRPAADALLNRFFL